MRSCRESVLINFLCVHTYTPGAGFVSAFFISSLAKLKNSHIIINVKKETILAGLHEGADPKTLLTFCS